MVDSAQSGRLGASMRNTMTYRDALRILDKDPKGLVVLDRALGGILSIATGGTSDTVLSIFDAQGRIIRIGRDVITDLRSQLQPSTRTQRTKRLEAALTALAVASYFEALHDADLPFAQQDLQLSRKDQAKLAGVESAKQLTSSPVDIDVPKPSPDLPYEEFLQTLLQWYVKLSARLSSFIQGLAIWDNLSESEREEAERLICTTLPQEALDRFEGLYIRLSTEVREFSLWASLQNDQATRRTVRRALSGVEDLLAEMSSHAAPADIANELVQAHTANLSRPILTEGETPSGMRLPTLEEGYLDPDFRVRTVSGEDLPADEAWWREADTRTDLTEYLAGTITSSTATTAPLVVLGQPGAGKSVLTKVLAARLPAADFLPIRVVLREVPAEADVQSQIEYAIRSATGERMQWPSVVRAAVGMTPIVLLDGLDELLQATGVSQSDYLMKVSQFQQREQDQGRAVVAVVTTRTAVANWCRYPSGSVALRLEPFRAEQIAEWVRLWNQHNTDYLQRRGLSVLPLDTVLRHEALASQPLLLLLLALYDADSNALQQGNGNRAGEPLDEASLYEQLLASFARREVLKNGEALAEDKIDQQVEQELQRLSLVALGIINRRRQWITEAELEEDLAALLGRREQVAQDFKTPLTEADVALSRFFFNRTGPSTSGRRQAANIRVPACDICRVSCSSSYGSSGYGPSRTASGTECPIHSSK